MFSNAAKKLLRRTIHFANIWAPIPIKWDQRSESVVVVNSKRRRLIWILTVIGLSLNWAFVCGRSIQLGILDPAATVATKVYMEYQAIVYFLPVLFHATTYFTFGELIPFLNSYRKFHHVVKGRPIQILSDFAHVFVGDILWWQISAGKS